MAIADTPTSQKAKDAPIAFQLTDRNDGYSHLETLVIRPESMSVDRPTLLTPTVTHGGAFFDDWGPGLAMLQLSGTTGWRTTVANGGIYDGAKSFKNLKDVVFVNFHARRAAAVQAGKSPDTVSLIFSDALNGQTLTIIPTAFRLMRDKRRPLLFQYQITAAVLKDGIYQAPATDSLGISANGLQAGEIMQRGLTSINQSLGEITAVASGAANWNNITSGALSFMNSVPNVIGAAASQLQNAANGTILAQPGYMTFGAEVCGAGANAMRMLQAGINISTGGLSAYQTFRSLQVAGNAFENIHCVLSNVLSNAYNLIDYGGLYGSSSCAYTTGAASISQYIGSNPLYALTPFPGAPPAVSSGAANALSLLQGIDPVLSPLPASQIGTALGLIATVTA